MPTPDGPGSSQVPPPPHGSGLAPSLTCGSHRAPTPGPNGGRPAAAAANRAPGQAGHQTSYVANSSKESARSARRPPPSSVRGTATYAASQETHVAGNIAPGSAVSGKNERTTSRLDTECRFRRLARQCRDAPPPVQAKRSPWVSVHRTSPFAVRWPTSATDQGSSRRIAAPGASMPSGGSASSIASGRPSNIRKIITSRATPPPPLRI